MQSDAIESKALDTFGGLLIGSGVLLGVVIILLAFASHRQKSKAMLLGSFGVWIGAAALLAWFTFDPAIRAMKMVNSPVMFGLIGTLAGLILFALRAVRKDVYGFLEITVAVGTLLALGREYDKQTQVTVIIGFVGAVYVIVRGLTNIVEARAKPK